MLKTLPGESKTGKNKAERTIVQPTVSPETEDPAIAISTDSKHEGDVGRSSRKKKLPVQDTKESDVRTKTARVTYPESSNMKSTLLYSRSGNISPKERSQQSSVQSATTTGEMTALGNNTNLFSGINMHQDKRNDNIWLFKVLDALGANDGYRKMCREFSITYEIMDSFTSEYSVYFVGSRSEGTVPPGVSADQDSIRCIEEFSVIEDIAKADKNRICLLIVTESHKSETPAGYVKLQLVDGSVPCTETHLISLSRRFNEKYFKLDRSKRVVLSDFMERSLKERDNPCMSRDENKPAFKTIYSDDLHSDIVLCYRCKTWPTMANEWITRDRHNNWPTPETIDELTSLGFFVVRKGHPKSKEKALEWRISLTLQERKLMFNLTDVQYKCYVVLKLLNRDVLQLNCITSYHWKTCLFHMIEKNESIEWEQTPIFHCIKFCIRQMLDWVKLDFCPNYFIPKENMFNGVMDESLRVKSKKKLVELFNVGFASLLKVHSSNLSKYISSQNNFECFVKLQTESTRVYKICEYAKKGEINRLAMQGLSTILGQYAANENITNFIEFLWQKLDALQVDTFSHYTPQETRRALSIFQPMVYTSLASIIAARSIKHSNPQVRDFLLLGCYVLFMKGDICGRLKFISVLYATGCYKACKWYLDQENENYIKINPSVCVCHNIVSLMNPLDIELIEKSQCRMSTCVIFLPTELTITPDALKYEMYKHVGVSAEEGEKKEKQWRWHYWAVVDSNIYFVFLKFLTNRKLHGMESLTKALYDISKINELIGGTNVRHRDVSYNLMAWCYYTVGRTHTALHMSRQSWGIKIPSASFFVYRTEAMRYKHYQFNSAKIFALVILYNIWFTRQPSGFQFCFQCFELSKTKKCSGCKTAQYCSKQCQTQNWAIHQTVCKIVRKALDIRVNDDELVNGNGYF